MAPHEMILEKCIKIPMRESLKRSSEWLSVTQRVKKR